MDEMMKDRSAGWELSGYGGNDSWRAYRKAMHKSRFLPLSQVLTQLFYL
jgi:protein phosphatase 1G